MMDSKQIKHMVNRFLSWKLPENFNPDGGITFKRDFNEGTPWPMKHEPSGTNLLDATQAEAMVRHMIDGLPGISDDLVAPALLENLRELYALVRGECPSLFNEDSGGNAELEMDIIDAIAKAEGRP